MKLRQSLLMYSTIIICELSARHHTQLFFYDVQTAQWLKPHFSLIFKYYQVDTRKTTCPTYHHLFSRKAITQALGETWNAREAVLREQSFFRHTQLSWSLIKRFHAISINLVIFIGFGRVLGSLIRPDPKPPPFTVRVSHPCVLRRSRPRFS